ICGMIGNSSASIPLMFASYGPDLMCTVFVRTLSESSTLPAGRELTKSMKSFAGTVIAPSSSTFAGTQQLMPTSRFVAVSRRRPGNLGGAAMTAGHGKGHWWRQRTPLGRTCPQTGLFIHMPGRLIHTRLPGAGAPSPPRACRSVGVQELAQRPDVPPEIVVVGH